MTSVLLLPLRLDLCVANELELLVVPVPSRIEFRLNDHVFPVTLVGSFQPPDSATCIQYKAQDSTSMTDIFFASSAHKLSATVFSESVRIGTGNVSIPATAIDRFKSHPDTTPRLPFPIRVNYGDKWVQIGVLHTLFIPSPPHDRKSVEHALSVAHAVSDRLPPYMSHDAARAMVNDAVGSDVSTLPPGTALLALIPRLEELLREGDYDEEDDNDGHDSGRGTGSGYGGGSAAAAKALDGGPALPPTDTNASMVHTGASATSTGHAAGDGLRAPGGGGPAPLPAAATAAAQQEAPVVAAAAPSTARGTATGRAGPVQRTSLDSVVPPAAADDTASLFTGAGSLRMSPMGRPSDDILGGHGPYYATNDVAYPIYTRNPAGPSEVQASASSGIGSTLARTRTHPVPAHGAANGDHAAQPPTAASVRKSWPSGRSNADARVSNAGFSTPDAASAAALPAAAAPAPATATAARRRVSPSRSTSPSNRAGAAGPTPAPPGRPRSASPRTRASAQALLIGDMLDGGTGPFAISAGHPLEAHVRVAEHVSGSELAVPDAVQLMREAVAAVTALVGRVADDISSLARATETQPEAAASVFQFAADAFAQAHELRAQLDEMSRREADRDRRAAVAAARRLGRVQIPALYTTQPLAVPDGDDDGSGGGIGGIGGDGGDGGDGGGGCGGGDDHTRPTTAEAVSTGDVFTPAALSPPASAPPTRPTTAATTPAGGDVPLAAGPVRLGARRRLLAAMLAGDGAASVLTADMSGVHPSAQWAPSAPPGGAGGQVDPFGMAPSLRLLDDILPGRDAVDALRAVAGCGSRVPAALLRGRLVGHQSGAARALLYGV